MVVGTAEEAVAVGRANSERELQVSSIFWPLEHLRELSDALKTNTALTALNLWSCAS